MRAIKFRGKSIDTGKWVYGNFYEPSHICFKEIGYDEFLKRDNVPIFNEHQVTEKTIGQFTGLYDKQGNEIYEGDILEFKWPRTHGMEGQKNHYSIRWDSEKAKFEPICIDFKDRLSLYDVGILTCKGTLIGNIFDNPELVRFYPERRNKYDVI